MVLPTHRHIRAAATQILILLIRIHQIPAIPQIVVLIQDQTQIPLTAAAQRHSFVCCVTLKPGATRTGLFSWRSKNLTALFHKALACFHLKDTCCTVRCKCYIYNDCEVLGHFCTT